MTSLSIHYLAVLVLAASTGFVISTINVPISNILKMFNCGWDHEEVCKTIKKHIKADAVHNTTECFDPLRRYCNHIIQYGGKSLVQEKAEEVRKRRENLFINLDITWFERHKSALVKDACEKFVSCMASSDNMEGLRVVVTDYFKRRNKLIVQRALQDAVQYMVPQVLPLNVTKFRKQVDSMEKVQLCYYMREMKYPHVIDRIYVDRFRQTRSSFQKGVDFLKGKLIDYESLIHRELQKKFGLQRRLTRNLTKLHFKSSISPDILDDEHLKMMYAEKVFLHKIREIKPPAPSSSLPLYPDATWFNPKENTVYISPTFFEPPLYYGFSPEAWNLAALHKVFNAILMRMKFKIMKEGIRVNLTDHLNTTLSSKTEERLDALETFVAHSVGSHSFTREMKLKLSVDQINQKLIASAVKKVYPPTNQKEALSLANFRMMNDYCISRPNTTAEVDDFHSATGKIHPLFQIYFVEEYYYPKSSNCTFRNDTWIDSPPKV